MNIDRSLRAHARLVASTIAVVISDGRAPAPATGHPPVSIAVCGFVTCDLTWRSCRIVDSIRIPS